jgi:hypothetical protein
MPSVSGCGGGSSLEFTPGKPPPSRARTVASHLAAPSVRTARQALAPALAAVTPNRSAYPPGTRIELDPKGWRQTGRFANSTGVLLIPHKPAQRVEIGFMQTGSGWHVTFMEAPQ